MYITKELYMVKKILTSIGEKSCGAIRYFLAEVNSMDIRDSLNNCRVGTVSTTLFTYQ